MKVFIGADYRGFQRKQELLKWLATADVEVVDLGAYEVSATGVENEASAYDSSANKAEKSSQTATGEDFNDAAIAVATAVREDRTARGVLICDSAHGMTIQANRYKGVRAAHCDSAESARLAREHDDANILCLSAHFLDATKMQEVIEVFLATKFEPLERRVRRINRLDERGDYD